MAGLEVINGDGEQFLVPLLIPRFVIGRGSDCDLTLDDDWASRQHAVIVEQEDGSHVVHDLESGNGTRWNGEVHEQHEISDGDVLKIGHTALVYRAAEESPKDLAETAGQIESSQALIAQLQSECGLLRSLLEKGGNRTDSGASTTALAHLNPHMDLLFPVPGVGEHLGLREESDWAFIGSGNEAAEHLRVFLQLGHRRITALVDELTPSDRIRLPSTWVHRLQGHEGVVQGLPEALDLSHEQALALVGGGRPATDLFLLVGDDYSLDENSLVAALSALSARLKSDASSARLRIHCIVHRESSVASRDREVFNALLNSARINTVFCFQQKLTHGKAMKQWRRQTAGALDLLSWLPRLQAKRGGVVDHALSAHLTTGGFATAGLSGVSDLTQGRLEQGASASIHEGLLADGMAPATARSAVLACFVGQESLAAHPDLLDRLYAALTAIEKKLPQARVSKAIYGVRTPGVRFFSQLFGLS